MNPTKVMERNAPHTGTSLQQTPTLDRLCTHSNATALCTLLRRQSLAHPVVQAQGYIGVTGDAAPCSVVSGTDLHE